MANKYLVDSNGLIIVEIYYTNTKLAKKCGNEKAIRKNYPNVANNILKRLLDLADFPNLKEYLDGAKGGKPHPLKENLKGLFWVHINGPLVMIFEPVGEIPLNDKNEPDYSQITAINILEVNVDEKDYTN